MLFQNATVFQNDHFLPNASVRVVAGRIAAVSTETLTPNPAEEVIDLEGDYLLPGLVDVQLYGGSQYFLNDNPTPETVRHIYQSHAQNGTTTLLPTIHSTSLEIMLQAMAAVQAIRAQNPNGVPGIHLEGPYFNPIKRGAHVLPYVRKPTETELRVLFGENADVIRVFTIAPEMFSDELLALLFQLKNPNTRLSAGHSNATYRQATDAFNTGQIPLATHLYNAMRGFESREPGLVGAIFDHPDVRVSVIADGYHCDPVAIRMAYKLLGKRMFLISDALFANPPRPNFTLGDFVVHVEPDAQGRGRYVNDEGNLAGSALTLIDCVRVAVELAGIPLLDALQMATSLPAEAIGLGDTVGAIRPGYVGNLIRTDKNLNVKNVWVADV